MEPLATVTDLANWTGDSIPADDAQALAILRAASSRVRVHCGRDFDSDSGVPAAVSDVVVGIAARVWRNPEGYIQDTTGPFTVRWTERVAEGVFLTGDERETLAAFRTTRRGIWTMPTTRGPVETGDITLGWRGGWL